MIDNSQGHSAYAEDALLTARMNIKPGGKQARMRNGWYEINGRKVDQSMIFPSEHPTHPGEPKGIKAVLNERGLYRNDLSGKCKSKCSSDGTVCCNKRVLELQPDFQEQ